MICISDTHNNQPKLPDGDVLIHAGDLSQSGSLKELQEQLSWLRSQMHPVKVVVAGNHDLLLDQNQDGNGGRTASERQQLDWGDIIYLQDSLTTVKCANGRSLRIYGSPYSPRHGNWAFQYPRDANIWKDRIPEKIDVLITHGPPKAHLDLLNLGCQHLLEELWRIRPMLHVFGHVHEGHGSEWLQFDALQAAFENTVIAGGGILNLINVVRGYLSALIRPAKEAQCALINPAIAGGLRDEERRRPIQINI